MEVDEHSDSFPNDMNPVPVIQQHIVGSNGSKKSHRKDIYGEMRRRSMDIPE